MISIRSTKVSEKISVLVKEEGIWLAQNGDHGVALRFFKKRFRNLYLRKMKRVGNSHNTRIFRISVNTGFEGNLYCFPIVSKHHWDFYLTDHPTGNRVGITCFQINFVIETTGNHIQSTDPYCATMGFIAQVKRNPTFRRNASTRVRGAEVSSNVWIHPSPLKFFPI